MIFKRNRREKDGGELARRFLVFPVLLALAWMVGPLAAQEPVQIYYVPLPEEEVLAAFQVQDTSGTPLDGDVTIRTVVGITITQTGTILYYDQWENDFEVRITDPDDLFSAGNPGGTQIWGDGDPSNGAPPGIPGDLITAGDVITLDNEVPASPRVPANIFFDGGDKIATTWPIAVTRAGWPVPDTGTVIAGAVEVLPTRDWGLTYQAPGGEDLATSCTTTSGTDDTADYCMFQDSRLLIMAQQDDTEVSIDLDNDGSSDVSQTLAEGESFTVDGAQAGTKVVATTAVQVSELTGDVGSRFEARWFTLVPVDSWSDSYLAPVGTVVGTDDGGRDAEAVVILFNPHASDLDVDVSTPSGTSQVTISAGGVLKYLMPGPTASSGAGFTSTDGRTFFAFGAVDDERTTWDWGYTVLPETSLSIDLKVGWAPGSNGTENSSPIWVTAKSATTVCADFDDDGVPDDTFPLTAYQSLKIFDTSDDDQTGMRIFSTTDTTCTASSPKDGELLAGTWGSDPSTASTGNPALDLGTTVLQVPPIILAKEGALAIDLNGNGLIDPGDGLRYIVSVLNSGTATATDVTVIDTLDPNTAYIVNTTTVDGVPVPDDDPPATPFPLDESGLNLGNLGPGVRVELEFLVEVDPNLTSGTSSILNRASVTTGSGESSDDSAAAPVFGGFARLSKGSDVVGTLLPGSTITYSIAPRSDGLELLTNVQVADSIPAFTTFVLGSVDPTQDSGPDPLVWDLGSNLAGTPGTSVGGYLCAGTVDLPASQDTYLDEDQPTNDFGSETEVRTNPDAAGNNRQRTLYQFDLSGLPADVTVTDAALYVTSRNGRSDHLANVKQVTTAWTDSASWNTTDGTTAWTTAGGDFGATVYGTLIPVGNDYQETADITTLVSGWYDGSIQNYGVILDPNGTDNGDARWASQEDGTAERRPFVRAFYTFASPGGCVTTVRVPAIQDTYIEADDVAADNSAAARLRTRPQSAGEINRTLFQFDLSLIPAGAAIESAVLTVTSRNARNNHLVDIKQITTAWAEATTNWNAPWTTPGGDFSATVLGTITPVGGDTPQTVDITSLVTDWLDGTTPNYGVILDPRGSDAGDAIWYSRDSADAGRYPGIEITFRSPTGIVTMPVTRDTFLEEGSQTADNGDTDPLETRPEAGDLKRALFQFDSAIIPPGATVNSATLTVNSANARSNHLAEVKHVTSAWTESANWNSTDSVNGWITPGGDFGATIYGTLTPIGGNDPVQADVTALVQSWVDGTLGDYGVILDPTGSDNGDADWNSREDGTTSRHAFIQAVYVAPGLGATTTTALSGEGALVTDGDTITVKMTLTSTTADTNVTPGTLSVSGTNGAGVSCGSPSPASQSIAADTPITFSWTCTASAGATPGSVTFSADAGGDSSSYAVATSNSVLVSPLLTFQVVVDIALGFDVRNIINTAEMTSDEHPDPYKNTAVDPVATGAIIGDSIWLDTDGDGVQDIGEPGLSNVVVELFADPDGIPGNGDEALVGTATSDALGRYSFSQVYPLASGNYYVDVDESTLPAGLEASPGNNGGISDPISVTGEDVFRDVDFGYRSPGGPTGGAVMGDFLWSDADGDGVQDPGEPGIGGVTIDLVGPGPDGILGTADDAAVATTATTADGSYFFTGVAPGQYQIVVTDTTNVLSGYTPTAGPQSQGSYISPPLTVGSGGVVSDTDFGFDNDALFSIADRIWLDGDSDGVVDPSESGGAGVTVNLLSDPDGVPNSGDEVIIATTVSDANGDFGFDGVPGGENYVVAVSDIDGVLRGATGTTPAAQAGLLAISNLSGNITGTSFGYLGLSSVFGRLWSDADGDGSRDPAEIGLGGVTVELQDGECAPTVDCPLAVTAPDGGYLFRGLSPALYTVVVTDLAGVLSGYSQTADPDEAGTCTVCDSQTTAIVDLTSGNQFFDFGYQNGSLDDISGSIFDDQDNDGVEDLGEPGLAGVTVALLDDAGNEIATATTDANGEYVFPDLPSGDYSVLVTDRDGVLDGYTLTSGLDELPAQPGDSDVAFGYARSVGASAIGDRLWLDIDGDGQPGPSEAGLSGVTVELWEDIDGNGVFNPAVDTLIETTVTDANGDYIFNDPAPGNYFVNVDETTLPVTTAGDLVETTYPAGVDPSAVIALSAAERFTGANFGYVPAAGTTVLGDRVWYDADGDGLQDPGEVGIAGVDIEIYGPNCSPCTVTTGPDGAWLATGLDPGEYFVSFDSTTLPAGYNATPTNLGGDDTFSLTVGADEMRTQLDLGFGGGTTATFGDFIWRDDDGDGTRGAGELGLAGVSVNLLDSSGNIIATTTTAADGSYQFAGVPDGSYTVGVSDLSGVLAGLQQSFDPDESGVCTTCDGQGSLTVTGGVSTPADANFGYAPSGGTGTVGDSVWHDIDGDGVQDAGESGIQGVTLELWLDVDGDGVITPGVDNLVRSAVTDQNGEYGFTSLPDGDYVVRVTDAAGVVSNFTQTGDPDESGACTVCDEQGVLTLAGGSGNFGQNFGYAAPVGMGYTISGSVFDDQDQDGDFDNPGEPGVEGAEVLLFNDLDGDGVLDSNEPLIGSIATNADGSYSLVDLPPGDYLLAVDTSGTAVDGYAQTTQTSSAGLQPVTIVAGDVAAQDFGFWSGGFITTPVTLAYFHAEGAGSVRFEWATATEAGNLGFHLYALTDDGLQRLNNSLVPSKVGDTLTPQRYSLDASGVEGNVFLLEDVDLYGQARYHGPFDLGQTYGRKSWEVQPTDWAGIRREHERQGVARKRRQSARLSRGLAGTSFASGDSASVVQLRVQEDGIYRVTYEALLAQGIDLAGVPTAQLALLEAGQPVPIRIEGRGPFGPGSYIEFLGRGLDTLYTRANVYSLVVQSLSARRVDQVGLWTPPSVETPEFYYETRKVESDRAYGFAAPGDDPWYDARLLAINEPVDAVFELELEDRLPGAGPVELTVAMWGVTNFPQTPDHHVVIEVNGVEMADEWFDGLVDRPVQVEIPEWVLQPQDNLLRILLPHDTGAQYDLVNYDHYQVRFPRPFLATDGRLQFTAAARAFRVDGLPTADVVVYRTVGEAVEIIRSVQVSGLPGDYSATFPGIEEAEATYFVSTTDAVRVPEAEIVSPTDPLIGLSADMVIIAHPDFIDGVGPLVDARRAEGLSVKVVDVEDLYHFYSHGIFDPQAIRAFIGEAYTALRTRYVLLVGGDTYDYFDFLGQGAISFVPTLYTRTDPIVHFAPVDPLFGDVDDDGVPDVSIGRWPVRTSLELQAVLDKTLSYADIDFQQTAVFSADGFDAPAGYSFTAASEEMLSYLSAAWQVERAYLDELYLADARQVLVDGINNGAALTSYIGHSGPAVWSFDGLFNTDDADALENIDRPTVITQWGCWNTYHVMPTYDTLGHRLLLNGDRGAAAVLGAATLTEATSEQQLGTRLFSRIGSKRVRLGRALIDAKRDLADTDPDRLDVLLGWTLLGDPTLVVEP